MWTAARALAVHAVTIATAMDTEILWAANLACFFVWFMWAGACAFAVHAVALVTAVDAFFTFSAMVLWPSVWASVGFIDWFQLVLVLEFKSSGVFIHIPTARNVILAEQKVRFVEGESGSVPLYS